MDISRRRRSLEPLHYGPHQCARRREYVLMALTLILALWWTVGGDRPEDRTLEMLSDRRGVVQMEEQRVLSPRVAGSNPAAPAMLCPKLNDSPYGRLWLRWQIEHRRETGFNWHRCAYGPVWLEAARQEGM